MAEEKPKMKPDEAKPEKNEGEKEEITLSRDKYDVLKQEAEAGKEFRDKYLRAYADLENARKRMVKEKADFAKYATDNLILTLLPIVDNLDRALESLKSTEDPTAVIKGVEFIRKQLHDLLDQQGISPIACVGEKFDPYIHEALMEVQTDEFPEGTIVEEIQRGYRLHDRVIRPAVVKVAKKSEEKKEN